MLKTNVKIEYAKNQYKTYVIEIDGQRKKIQRTTNVIYTHVILAKGSNGWGSFQFAENEFAAKEIHEKALKCYDEVEMVQLYTW